MKKKLMFLIPSLGNGGAERVLVDTLNNLEHDKFDITLVSIFDRGNRFKELKSHISVKIMCKSSFKSINKFYVFMIKYLPKILYIFTVKEKYDVEVAYLEGLSTNLVANSTNNNSKKVAWVHCNLNEYNWVKKYTYKDNQEKYYKNFDKIVFVSKKAKAGFDKLFKVDINKKIVINNPIFNEIIVLKSKQFNVRYKKKTILAIGSLSKVKGFERLIEAYLNSDIKNEYDLKIIGEGNERDMLEKKIKESKLKSIELLGFKENPYPYIKASDLIVSSSYSEAYPTGLLESIILGKVIVATDINGNNEVLKNGELGLICENTVDGIQKGIEEIIKNKELNKSFIKKIHKYSKEVQLNKDLNKISKLLYNN